MTKEELKQEAEEEARKHWLAYPLKQEIFKQGYLAGAEPREKRIAELEKENAELKKKYVKNITDCDICDTYCNSQLIKAKEIINTLRNFFCEEIDVYVEPFRTSLAEANQFLKDSEVMK